MEIDAFLRDHDRDAVQRADNPYRVLEWLA
jgi:hypothetical protein